MLLCPCTGGEQVANVANEGCCRVAKFLGRIVHLLRVESAITFEGNHATCCFCLARKLDALDNAYQPNPEVLRVANVIRI